MGDDGTNNNDFTNNNNNDNEQDVAAAAVVANKRHDRDDADAVIAAAAAVDTRKDEYDDDDDSLFSTDGDDDDDKDVNQTTCILASETATAAAASVMNGKKDEHENEQQSKATTAAKEAATVGQSFTLLQEAKHNSSTTNSAASDIVDADAVDDKNANDDDCGNCSLHDFIQQGQWKQLVNSVQELRAAQAEATTSTAVSTTRTTGRIPQLHARNSLGLTPLQASLEKCSVVDSSSLPNNNNDNNHDGKQHSQHDDDDDDESYYYNYARAIVAMTDHDTVNDEHPFLYTPLERACLNLMQAASASAKDGANANGNAVTVANNANHDTGANAAVTNTNASAVYITKRDAEDCIRAIVQCRPAAILDMVQATNDSEWTIFHVLLQHQPSLALLEDLMVIYAKEQGKTTSSSTTGSNNLKQVSGDENDKDNEDSSNTATAADAWQHIAKHVDNHGMLAIHYAIQEHASSDVILKLFQAHPDCCCSNVVVSCLHQEPTTTTTSLSTLDMAVFHGCSYAVLKALVAHAPGKVADNNYGRGAGAGRKRSHKRQRYHNKYKNTPLHLLFHLDVKNRWLSQPATTTTTTSSAKNSNDSIRTRRNSTGALSLLHNDDDTIMSSYKMAWYLILQNATYVKKTFGHKKVDPKEQAVKLLNLKGEGNKTVLERMEGLKEEFVKLHLSSSRYAEFTKLYNDVHNGILQRRAFPEMDFE